MSKIDEIQQATENNICLEISEKYDKWYNRVYLCLEDTKFEKPNTYRPIIGFNCYKYNSFQIADDVWNNNLERKYKSELRHTIIPICKWVPSIFDIYILNWKLKNIYWLGQHKIYNGSGIRPNGFYAFDKILHKSVVFNDEVNNEK